MPFIESSSRQLGVDIFDEPYLYKKVAFEWCDEDSVFFKAIIINYLSENEDLLFKIVYGVLKQYSGAKLWIEQDWFYVLDDLERIKNKPFDNEWCYKNPQDL